MNLKRTISRFVKTFAIKSKKQAAKSAPIFSRQPPRDKRPKRVPIKDKLKKKAQDIVINVLKQRLQQEIEDRRQDIMRFTAVISGLVMMSLVIGFSASPIIIPCINPIHESVLE